jgi:predicted amino acid racemase
MLEEYANIEESAFDIRVDDTMMVKSEITGVLSLSDEVTVDFSQISEDVSSLEKIDLTSANVQVISLNLSDVVDLTDADNTITIIGNSSDSVSLKNENGNNWSTSNSVTENGHIFDIYSNSGDPTVTLKVEDTINDTVV